MGESKYVSMGVWECGELSTLHSGLLHDGLEGKAPAAPFPYRERTRRGRSLAIPTSLVVDEVGLLAGAEDRISGGADEFEGAYPGDYCVLVR